jgi:hypothetical protein
MNHKLGGFHYFSFSQIGTTQTNTIQLCETLKLLGSHELQRTLSMFQILIDRNNATLVFQRSKQHMFFKFNQAFKFS